MSDKRQFQTHPLVLPPSSPALPATTDSPATAAPQDTEADSPDAMMPYPLPIDMAPSSIDPFGPPSAAKLVALHPLRKRLARFVAPVIVLLLIGAITLVWLSPASSSPSLSGISQQSFGNTSAATSQEASGGDVHVYVVGAVRHPGVYDLPQGARVYQLIAAAGGTLPNANLVALNMAATLTDGEEVYVISNGEIPPTYMGGVPGPGGTSGTATVPTSGQLVNINTASLDEMRNALHISSKTAQAIINYRTQHGPFTSVDQLLQVVSRSIYDKIKGEVTV